MEIKALAPLVVDLDGTLVEEDMLIECLRYQLPKRPLSSLAGLSMALLNKGAMKEHLAKGFIFSPKNLSYRHEVVQLVEEARTSGVRVFLATGSVKSIAEPIASHLGLFSGVFASTRGFNNTGQNKARALVELFGRQGFDYVGNAKADLDVWQYARYSYLAGSDPRIKKTFWALPNAVPLCNKGGS